MVWQSELFAIASKEEVEKTEFLLDKYVSMMMLIQDFETNEKEMAQVAVDGETARRIDDDDLYADKTANAVILITKQKWIYREYCFYTNVMRQAVRLIRDPEARKVVDLRFIQGYSRSETINRIRGLSDSTIDRRIGKGIQSVANSLKLWEVFERKSDY